VYLISFVILVIVHNGDEPRKDSVDCSRYGEVVSGG